MQRGLVYGIGAYALWGLSPVFWKELDHLSAHDTMGYRILWTAALMALYHVVRGTWGRLVDVFSDPRLLRLQVIAAAMMLINWSTWVWAIYNDHVLQASLGYFMVPLVSVFLGVIVLGERLRPLQWTSVGLAAAGVAWLTFEVGTVPVVALVLAATFGIYGLVKKTADLPAVDSLATEVLLLSGPALVFVAVRAADGHGVMGPGVPLDNVLLVGTGLMSLTPLLFFAGAARRVTLTVLGVLQYLAPTINFLLGTLVYDEPFDGGRLVGYSAIWVAVVVFTADSVLMGRRTRRV